MDPLMAAGVFAAISGRSVVVAFPSRAAAEAAYERAVEMIAREREPRDRDPLAHPDGG